MIAAAMDLLSLPPIVYFAAAAALYPLALLVRRAGGTIVLGLALVAAGSFIVLPGGREMTTRAGSLPDRPQRLACVGEAIKAGAPIRYGASRASACEFTGRGFPGQGDPAEARQMLDKARSLGR